MEGRATLAEYRRGEGSLVVYAGTQFPHVMRTQIADILGMRENQVRVIAPEVGGGFGAKANVYPDEILVAWLAMRLGRPVRWLEQRNENLATMTHGRDQIDYISAACNERRHDPRPEGTAAGRPRRLPVLRHGRDPDPDHVDGHRPLPVHRPPVRPVRRLHQQDADRRLPRRGPAGGDLLPGTHDGRDRRRSRAGRGRGAEAELHQEGSVPLHDADGPGLRQRRLRAWRWTRRSRSSGYAAAQAPRPTELRKQGKQGARRRLRQLRRDLRLRSVQDHGRRRLRVGHRARRAERQGDHLHRRLGPRPGPRDGLRPDRGGRARDRHQRRHPAPRRHVQRALLQQRHRRQPLAGARRERAEAGDGGRPRQDAEDRRAPARGVGGGRRAGRRARSRSRACPAGR